jgi:hypothetical protein
MPVSLSLRSSVSSHDTQHIGESFLVSTETPLSLPFTRSVVYPSSIQHESGAFEFPTEMPASFPSPISVVSLSSPLQKSRVYEPFTQTRLSLPFASSVSSHDTQRIGDSLMPSSGLLLSFSSHSTTAELVSLRLLGTWYARGSTAFEIFGVSSAIHISGFVGSPGIFGQSSHLWFSELISDSELLLATDPIKVDASLRASLSTRLRAPTSFGDCTFVIGNSGLICDTILLDESVDSVFPRSIHFSGDSSPFSDARVTGLEPRSLVPPSTLPSCVQGELSVTVRPSSADMADSASASSSSSVGVVAGSVIGVLVLCSAIAVLLVLILRRRPEGSRVTSAEMDGDLRVSGSDTWTNDVELVFENQLDLDDNVEDDVEIVFGSE